MPGMASHSELRGASPYMARVGSKVQWAITAAWGLRNAQKARRATNISQTRRATSQLLQHERLESQAIWR